jgi:hypothetical protein
MAGAIGRGVTAALFTVVVVALTSAPWPAAAESGPSASGPTDIVVPYLGTASIEPAEGWQIMDCDRPAAASPLVVACDAGHIELAATTFDPDAGATIVPVTLSNGRTTLAFDYVVTTAPPEAPSVASARSAAPAAAGSVVMVPISDLGVECAVCAEGGALEVVGVRPEGAGTASATSTHAVFRPAAGFDGEAELVVRFVDDYGTRSDEASYLVPVYRPGSHALVALSIFAPLAPSGSTSLDLASLAFSAGDSDLRFVGCGAAVHGTVVCGSDGTAVYTPAGAAIDQFSFRVAAADGEQATGSVTLVADDGARPTSGLVAAAATDGDEPVASVIVPAIPVESISDQREGAFAALIATLDRVGAR